MTSQNTRLNTATNSLANHNSQLRVVAVQMALQNRKDESFDEVMENAKKMYDFMREAPSSLVAVAGGLS